MVSLVTYVSSLKLRNPIVLASGILGSKISLINRVIRESDVGAITTKSFTKEPRVGYDTPIIAYVKAGIINAVGLTNPGYRKLQEILGNLKNKEVPIIVSIAASTPKEFMEISCFAEEHGANAVELNLSCPHVKGHGLEISQDPKYAGEIVETVKSTLKIPVIAKLGLTDKILETAVKIQDKGADAIAALNTVKAMTIDVYAKKPVLSNVFGGLSGPAIHPIAVRVVYELYRRLTIPIIGVGGVIEWDDAVEFILAGASAVGVGSAIATRGIIVLKEIYEGIKRYMEDEGFKSLTEMIGYVHKK